MRTVSCCLLVLVLLTTLGGCGGGSKQYLEATRPLVEQYQQAVDRLVEFEKQPYSAQQSTLDFYQKFSQDMAQIKTGFCLQSNCADRKVTAFHADFVKLLSIADLMAQAVVNDLLRYQTVIAGTRFKDAGQRKAEVQMLSDKWEAQATAARQAYSNENEKITPAVIEKYQIKLPSVGANPLIAALKTSFK